MSDFNEPLLYYRQFRKNLQWFFPIDRKSLKRPANQHKSSEHLGLLTGRWIDSPYYMIVLKSAIHAVTWLTQMFGIPFQIQRWRSTILNVIRALSANITYYVTTILLMTLAWQAKQCTVRWWVQCAYNESRCLHCVWSVCNSELIQSGMQLVWCWLTFLPEFCLMSLSLTKNK